MKEKNILGEDVEVGVPLNFKWNEPILWVFRGKFICNVAPNGWTGKSKSIQYPLGEIIIDNLNGELSFKEASEIMGEYWKRMTPEKAIEFVNEAIKREKNS